MASMSTTASGKKLRVLLIPFFATSHIGPFADLAVRLTAASPNTVEATVAVTPANVPVLRSLLERHEHGEGRCVSVKIATYPFPAVDGLPPGVENLGKAAPNDAWRIDATALDEDLMRPMHEALIRESSPDTIVTDFHFLAWNAEVADELGVPCVHFQVIGAFSVLAMRHLTGDASSDCEVVSVPRFPPPAIRIPRTELPAMLRTQLVASSTLNRTFSAQGRCFGTIINTFLDLEQSYCEMYEHNRYVKHAYFVGPLSLPLSPAGADDSRCINWLDSKPIRSVVYLCFGTLAPVSEAQLHELALGLEASGKSFLWVVRTKTWVPPEGWAERVGDRGMVVTTWAPQTAILGHLAVGAFVTHCGWNSVLETVAAGVPVLTWPVVFEQFITERLVTEVLGIGERVWDGRRSTTYGEMEVVPAEAVARAVGRFFEPGGTGETARVRAQELAVKAHAAVAEGGPSCCDLRRMIDGLIKARAASSN